MSNNNLPQIINNEYHEMSWDDIRTLQQKIINKKYKVYIQQNQLLLYLNQMNPTYSSRLKLIQNGNIISLIGFVILLFINWKLSLIALFLFIVTALINPKKANEYIYKNCVEDIAFLKFALSVELITLEVVNNAHSQ